MTNWIDCHCHLTDDRLFEKSKSLISNAQKVGITEFALGGIEPSEWLKQKKLKETFKVHTSFGLHPWWIHNHPKSEIEKALVTLEAEIPQADFLGECGLDFFKDKKDSQKLQIEAFNSQLELALKFNKPLLLHVVEAHDEAIKALKGHSPFPRGGLIHSFTGGPNHCQEYLDLGFHISISGVICRPGYKKLKSSLKNIPLDRLMIETDAPDQSPLGRDSSDLHTPNHLILVAKELSQYFDLDYKALLDKSSENFRTILEN